MSSTTSAGPPAPVGNTLYGEPPRSGSEPSAPPGAERYAPPTEVTALPEPVATEIPKGEYPPEAQRAGLEGEVKLRLRIGADGRVEKATVVRDPGHGFGPAAVESALRHFRFRPATRHGDPVATEIVFTVRYELP